jgi:hypothetical protein
VLGKEVGGWILCNTICTHVSKCKTETCWNHSRNQGGVGWRRMVEKMNLCMRYLMHGKNLCKCHNVPSPSTTIKGKKLKAWKYSADHTTI